MKPRSIEPIAGKLAQRRGHVRGGRMQIAASNSQLAWPVIASDKLSDTTGRAASFSMCAAMRGSARCLYLAQAGATMPQGARGI